MSHEPNRTGVLLGAVNYGKEHGEANRPQGASLTTCTGAEGDGGPGGAGLVFCGSLCVSCPPRLCIPRLASAPQARAGSGDGVSPRGRSSRVRPRGAPSRRPARPGVPGTTRYRVSRRSRRTSGTRVPRPPLALPTRSNNHGPRRSPDRGRDIRARRAAAAARAFDAVEGEDRGVPTAS